MQVVGFSYDPVKTLAMFSQAKNITFPLVSDEGSKTIKKLSLEYKRGLPYPGVFIIGDDGKVKGKLFKDGYKTRHSVDEILAMANKVAPAKPVAAGK